MMSVFDWSEMQGSDKAWAGREWFVVRKAEVRMAADKTLVPFVKMGLLVLRTLREFLVWALLVLADLFGIIFVLF